MEYTIYQDEDMLGSGKFYGYVSADGHVQQNFGPYESADLVRCAIAIAHPIAQKSAWTL